MSPEAIEVAPFLLLYAVLLLTAVLVRAVGSFLVQSKQDAPKTHLLGRYEVAMVMGGCTQVVQTALAGLVDSGAVAFAPGAVTEFRSRPQVQPPLDAVQQQVRALLPDHTNGLRLASAFRRSEAAGRLRRELSLGGVATAAHWRYKAVAIVARGYFWLVLPTACLLPSLKGASAATGPLIMIALFVHLLVFLVCHALLPLTLTRRGTRLHGDVNTVLYKYNGKEIAGSSDRQLEQTRSALAALGTEWSFAPGCVDSPNSLVAFAGWGAYRNKWGQHLEPQQYWTPLAWPFSRTSGTRRGVGLLYRAAAVGCGLGAVWCGLLVFSGSRHPLLVMVGLVVLPAAGARMATLGKKHSVVRGDGTTASGAPRPSVGHGQGSGNASMAPTALPPTAGAGPGRTAPRPSVLYLRSFAEDADLEQGPQRVKTALGFRSSYIEELVHVLRPFGDLVAIGNPGAALPGLGPAQLFVPQDSSGASESARERWQTEVLRLMDHSSLVVLAAGLGDGLLWEFRQATARVPPRNLVVFVPLDSADYALFRQHAGACFPFGLPADPRGRGKGGLRYGLIYFDPDWTPHFVRFRLHPFVQLHLGRLAIRPSLSRVRNETAHAWYPVFRHTRAPWPGLQIPVPFARAVRHRVLRGLSCGAVSVLAGASLFFFLLLVGNLYWS